MSERVVLTLRPTEAHLDLEGITPERVAGLSSVEIGALGITADGRAASLGDFFAVEGHTLGALRIEGDLRCVVRVGAGMTTGELDVRGDVGDDAGLGMTGGVLRIAGAAGNRLGAARPGASRGMTGGEILVSGSCGTEAAARARRGLVVVGGTVGRDAGRAMIAGTLVVVGDTGAAVGRGSRRGSVIALGAVDVPATYRYACTFEPPFVRMLLTYLRRHHGVAVDPLAISGRYRRYCGDLVSPGKGEILAWARS